MKRAKPQYSQNFSYLLKLLACVLNDTMPPKPNADTDWASVFYMAECHSVAGMVYCALLKLDKADMPSSDIFEKFKQFHTLDLLKDTNVDVETKAILNIFREKNIKAVPVKGYCIKYDYPETAMRTMTDTDILCCKEDFPDIISVFEGRGYSVSGNEFEIDAAMMPFHHYEIHSKLIDSFHNYEGYFDDYIDRAVASEDSPFYALSADDKYIYLLSHLAKHLESGGAGIRMIMDVYVFNKAHASELSLEYLSTELKKLHLEKFRDIVENLAHNWFSGAVPDTDSLVADYILCSCTFGTSRNAFLGTAISKEKASGKKQTGTKRVMRSVFPSTQFLSKQYPALNKAKILYPLYLAKYWFRRLFVNKNVNTDNLRNYYLRTDSEDGRRVAQMLEDMGLDER